MSFLVALAADCDEILRSLIPLPLVREVMHLETLARTAVLAEAACAIERHLPAQLPSVAAEVCAVLPLTLPPCFASAVRRPEP
jgi:hypothetical protein